MMNRYGKKEFRGIKNVYRFTLRQLLKNKGNIAVLVVMFVLAMGAMLLLGIMSGSSGKGTVANTDQIAEVAELIGADVGDDGVAAMMKGTLTSVQTVSEIEGTATEDSSPDIAVAMQMAYSIIIMMLSVMAINNVVSMVVEEKDSKLMEFFLVNIRPLALLGGKILAAMMFAVIQILVVAAGIGLGLIIGGMATSLSIGALISCIGINLGPLSILFMIIFVFIGFATYSLIAAFSAAGCSTVEDVNAAMSLGMIITMLGFAIAMVIGITGNDVLIKIFSILPFFAPYVAPAQYALGTIGFVPMLISLAVQVVVAIFQMYLAARTYEATTVYRGERLKLSKVLKMTFERRKV